MDRRLLCMLLAVWLIGCATPGQISRMHRFEQTEKVYRDLIERSNLEAAGRFVSKAWRESHPLAPGALRVFHVTDVSIMKMTVSEDNRQVDQTVDIRYFRTDQMIEKGLRDYQQWQFDEEKKKWVLNTGLPMFE